MLRASIRHPRRSGPSWRQLNAPRTAVAAVLADYRSALASVPLISPPGREWMLRRCSRGLRHI
jgi:hypothetical protein